MKSLLNTLVIFSSIILLSFTSSMHGDGTYKIDVSGSKIEWIGKKFSGEHSGDLSFKSGQIVMGGHGLKASKFVMDMPTIKCTDLSGESAEDLESHLKNDDFFSTEKFPTATIELISAAAIPTDKTGNNFSLKANLTIKGITNEISFPAKVIILNKKVEVTAKVVFDRTKWDIKYKSKTIFPDIGDKFIYDDIALNISIVADLQ